MSSRDNDFAYSLVRQKLGETRSDRSIKTLYGHRSFVQDLDIVNELGGHTGCVNALSTRSRRVQEFFAQARWLSDANTNARVYRSHYDRVKRIVTESSPFLFLTCSEDGDVRQWDLRLPSSAYPAPRSGRSLVHLRDVADAAGEDLPPPLISYRNYNLDLNSISCATSRPHYIALGGAHLHCFLHDRRMLGRDVAREAGRPSNNRRPLAGTHEDETMSSATRCVKRFAPNERRHMNSHDYGHITACKISDANPNEMVVSWSGDHVYSFDLVKSPDARDAEARKDKAFHASRLKNQTARNRKRKHTTASSSGFAENPVPSRRLRRVADSVPEAGQTASRPRAEPEDGQDINPVASNREEVTDRRSVADMLLSEAQVTADRVARAVVRLRQTLFNFSVELREEPLQDMEVLMENSADLTPFASRFTDALGQCASLLPQLDEIIRGWSYPVTPTSEDVTLQNTLRRNRQSTWRFVQASGCLASVLGGQLQTSGTGSDPRLHLFRQIRPAVHEGRMIQRESMFCYDFLKAILCWIDGGAVGVLNAFIRPPSMPPDSPRFPLSDTDTLETFVPKLHEYLHELSDESKAVIDLDMNPFLREEFRQVFESQTAAVEAFTQALTGVELRTGQGTSTESSSASTAKRVVDKGVAARFWVVTVGRSLLREAAQGVTFDFVNRAFGGLISSPLRAEHAQENTNPNEGEAHLSPTPLPAVTVDNAPESDDAEEEDYEALLQRRSVFGSRIRERALLHIDVPYSSHSQTYKGHCNTRTVKDVNYYGLNDEYVVSGSDDGMFFIWDRKSGKIVNILEGDGEVVNVIQGHPYEPMIACSGIDSTIKIFGPGGSTRERRNAARGIDLANPSGGSHLSLPFGRRRRMRRAMAREDDNDGDDGENNNLKHEEAVREDGQFDLDDELGEPKVERHGLRSRRALHREYEITSQNDAERRRGLGNAFMTEDTLERLAAALQRGQLRAVDGQAFDGGGGMILVDDQNCSVM
ncbi:hypothetical protein DV738_g3038, partial [Chaetothyriales sp. CBS 135597]